jgi:Uma2 family endonuclease
MVINTKLEMSVEMFDEWVATQEGNYEYIAGEAIEVSSKHYASEVAGNIFEFVKIFVRINKLGRVTGADGGYRVAGERYIPDVGYVSYAKQPNRSLEGYLSHPPDLAVEVISNPANTNELHQLRIKLTNYLLEGVTVWVVNPETEVVEIHRNNHPVEIIGKDGILRGYDVLPNFELAVRDIFEE